MLYFDTSALMKLCRVEDESDALQRWLGDQTAGWFTSTISEVELVRAVARSEPAALPAVARILGECDCLDADQPIRIAAGSLTPATVRSLDAIHLATALEIADEITAFITYDIRLGSAAEAHGLRVAAPR